MLANLTKSHEYTLFIKNVLYISPTIFRGSLALKVSTGAELLNILQSFARSGESIKCYIA
jgi:hypothetical protein